MIEIANKLYYVGVNDRNKQLFEGLWPLPHGVSYNSYLIDDEKVVSHGARPFKRIGTSQTVLSRH